MAGENYQRLGGEFLVNTTTLHDQAQPTITSLPSGGFVVSWVDQSGEGGDASGLGIKAQIFDAAGAKVGGEFLVNTETLVDQARPTITSLTSGGFVVSWTDRSGQGGDASFSSIKAQIFNAAGAKVGGEFLVNTATLNFQQGQTITSLASGGFVVSWSDGSGQGGDASGGIKAQIFNATGAKVGAEFLVNTATLGSQGHPTITSLTSGGFVVSWTDPSGQGGDASGFGVKAQIFNATGAKVGAEFLVNTATLSDQQQPKITSLASGGFVVSWFDNSGQGGDASGHGSKAQIFDAAGAKVGAEFLVNTATLNDQLTSTITSLSSGGFVVSWSDLSGQGGDTSTYGVKAQIFDAAGIKVGAEFLVNTATLGFQFDATITSLAAGGFVVSWADGSGEGGDASGAAIKAQIFAVAPPAPLLATQDSFVYEDGSIGLNILLSSSGAPNINTVITVTGIPSDWTVDPAFGMFDSATGTWTITVVGGGSFVGGPIVSPPADSDADLISLEVTATNISTVNGLNSSAGTLIDVIVDAVADAPLLTVTDASGDENTALTLGIAAAVRDNDGSESITAIRVSGVVDGFALSAGTNLGDGVWSLIPAQLGGLTVTPPADFSGPLTLQIDVLSVETSLIDTEFDLTNNANSTFRTVTLIWNAINDPPVATDDALSATEDQPVTYVAAELVGNDTDADGDSLVIASVANAVNGSVLLNPDGSVTFVPDADFFGDASFDYVVSDGNGGTDAGAALVTVANVNDEPTGFPIISGIAAEGQLLTASNDIADADGLGVISYQWERDGFDIAGATGATYLLSQADVGAEIRLGARYTDGGGTIELRGSAATAVVANVNDAPTGAVTISGTAAEDQLLTASNTLADEDGLGLVSYQWQRGGIDIIGAIGATYLLGQADVGAAISVVASYTDSQGTAESVASAATAAVTNINDAPTGAVTISATAAEDQPLTASNNLADEDGLGAIGYQWQRGGVDIAGATGATYLLGQADVGAAISVVASYTDGQGTAESAASAATAAVANVNDTPIGAVTISGTAAEDQLLTASNNLADEDGIGAIGYQWQRGGTDIVGATGATYLIGQADVGAAISVVASYTDGQGTAESAISAATAAVTNVNDAPTGVVTISGTAAEGQLLTASSNLADEDGLGTIVYQWQRGGVDIVGATGASYLLGQADVGAAIRVVARYSDSGGTLESVASGATAAVTGVSTTQTYTGTAANNFFAAPDAANWVVNGLGGNDTLITQGGRDVVSGGTGNDIIAAGDNDDIVVFTGSNGGFDSVAGGAGNDRIEARAAGTIIGLTALAGIEMITANGFLGVSILGSSAANSFDFNAVTLDGIQKIDLGAGNDTLVGSQAADTIIGGAGNDNLNGSGGDDIFQVDTGAGIDRFTGGDGFDQIVAIRNNFTIGIGLLNGIEAISAGGFTNVRIAGTSGADLLDFSLVSLTNIVRIDGGNGNDTITGSIAADTILGGDGNDSLNGLNGNDLLQGGAGNDNLQGGDGNDTLQGDGGDDTLNGGTEADRLVGGSGQDALTGGLGNDVFAYLNTNDSRSSNNHDTILDFAQGNDLIDLAAIDANRLTAANDAFSFIGENAFTGVAGQLRYQNIGGNTVLQGDVDGDGLSDLYIQIVGSLELQATDFLF